MNDTRHPYTGRWVAKIGGRIVAHGGTPEQAQQAARAARPKEKATVEFVTPSSPIILSPTLELVRSKLPADQLLYLIGGAVRDMLLGRPVRDYDFALPSGAIPFARKLAKQLKADFYILDQERDIARVLLQGDEPRATLDFSAFRGDGLEADLQARDFTLNAIAIDMHQPEALLDPLGGAPDLLAKRLRACHSSALENDPIRVLRAIRMAASFALRIDVETRTWMRAAAPALRTVSAERTRDELVRLLLVPKPATCLRALDMLGALEPVLPELAALKGIEQSLPHRYDVFEHTLKVLEKLEVALSVLAEEYGQEGAGDLHSGLVVLSLGRYRQQISQRLRQELVPGRPLKALLFLAALHHDSSKLPEETSGEEDPMRFGGHEQVGAARMRARAEALHFSNDEIERLVSIVNQHSQPALMLLEAPPTRRAIYRYFRAAGEAGVETCLLSVADVMGKYGPELPRTELQDRLDMVRALLEAYFEHYDQIIDPPSLLSGDELMSALGLAPGPDVGRILETIREAQAAGEVATKDQALDLAHSLKK